MAFLIPPRLAEIRASVAVRLKFVKQAAQSPTLRDQLDEEIRAALNELLLDANWVELRVRSGTELVDGQAAYDWPDNMDPGRLERVLVIDANGHEHQVRSGVHPTERASLGGDQRGLPLRYEVINQEIVLYPAPDGERYAELVFEGYERPRDPINDDDRIPVQKEALIRLAAARGQQDVGVREVEIRRAKEYIRDLRPDQSDREVMSIGGSLSKKYAYNKHRRTGDEPFVIGVNRRRMEASD